MIRTDNLHFKILAPAGAAVPSQFSRSVVDARSHRDSIFNVQVLRGMALRECGQMSSHLTADGRHVQRADGESWHVLLLNGEDRLIGCARYRLVDGGAESFGASESALAQSHHYGPILRRSIEHLIAAARLRNKGCGEAGGWALRPEARKSTAAFNVALTTFALALHLNSGVALTTATTNNHSASILCRIGARRVAEIPAYYEPKYGSTIELLQFHAAHPRYAAKLEQVRQEALDIPVICATESSRLPSFPSEGRQGEVTPLVASYASASAPALVQ